jgi:hypothetical protein
MERVRRFFIALSGERVLLPASLLQRWPELAQVRWRRGGLPPRVGGWCLGHRSVAAITLWRTVFLAPQTVLSAPLLLHEFRHVQQFSASRLFPARYLWESLRRGYAQNRYEHEADAFACARVRKSVSNPVGRKLGTESNFA